MGISPQNHRYLNATQKSPKIPDYAKDYKNEYLFIRGIDKCFEYYWKRLHEAESGIFQKRIDQLYKYLNKLKLHNKIEIDEYDIGNPILLQENLAECLGAYVIGDRVDEEATDNNIDIDFPGWTHLNEAIDLFYSKFGIVDTYYTIGRFHDMFFIEH